MTKMKQQDAISELGFAVDDYFGGCPECGKLDSILNVGRDHIAVCHRHKNKWQFGSNLFSSWRDENEETWQKNQRLLQDYLEVEPLPPTDPSVYADKGHYRRAMQKMLRKVRERRHLIASICAGA
jgi:hypothetical protein